MSESAAHTETSAHDVRPVVRTSGSGNLGLYIFAGLLLAGGLALFLALDARRQQLAAPATVATVPGGGMIAAPPPLSLPQGYLEAPFEPAVPLTLTSPALASGQAAPPTVVTRVVERSVPAPAPNPLPQAAAGPFNVPVTLPAVPLAPTVPEFDPEDRVSAGWLANPSYTVPKGTIVAAVLETALDSSRAGGVRAIVSRDVRSFDGSRVLIPRGSRLYGEYAADVSAGQKRAMIQWQRLLRPDGVTVELASPSADPLGRAGVQGKVDSNFFARFGGAILQSVLDIGVALATGAVTDGDSVIINAPQGAQQVAGQALPPPAQPRLRVQQGTSVSVFVARDLDFSSVDG